MKVKIEELKQKLINGLALRGLSRDDAQTIASVLVEAELRGKKTHGINKVFTMERAIQEREGKPEIVKEKGNYALIDAHKELGHLTANFAVDTLLQKVKEFDNAVVAVNNSYYFTMAGVYAEMVAKEGYVAIILNNGGPSAIAPFGGVDPILGTNPIAIGIPTDDGPIVLDMTTGERPWGEINLAMVEERSLQPNTFINKEGEFTTKPADAEAIIPFGGHKGYGLNFMFEILTGAFVGAKMGLQAKTGYDLGFLFMAYSPTMFTSQDAFNNEVRQLVREVKESRTMKGTDTILLPGESSLLKMNEAIKNGELDIKDETWNKLLEFESGENLEKKIGMKQ